MSRPVERIDVVINTLREYWMRHPDQRLGQLLLNSLRYSDGTWPDGSEGAQDLIDLIWEKDDADWYARFWFLTNEAIRREIEIERLMSDDPLTWPEL